LITLQGINISHQKCQNLKIIFLFPFGGIRIRSLEGTLPDKVIGSRILRVYKLDYTP